MSSILTEEIDNIYQFKDKECFFRSHFKKLLASNYKYYGIKTAILHKAAERIASKLTLEEIMKLEPLDYEELTLLGLAIVYSNSPFEEKLKGVDYFLSINDNWAASDIIANSIKVNDKVFFDYLVGLLDKDIWHVKFAINAFMFHYLNEEFLDDVLNVLAKVDSEDNFVVKAVASFLAEAYLQYPQQIVEFIDTAPITMKALRAMLVKVRLSKRIPEENKELLEEIYKDIVCRRATLLK